MLDKNVHIRPSIKEIINSRIFKKKEHEFKLSNTSNTKKIITVYDLIHEKLYNKKNVKKKSLAITRSSQLEIKNYKRKKK